MNQKYNIRELPENEFMPLFEKNAKYVFESDHSYSVRDILNKSELDRIEVLKKSMGEPLKIYLGVFDEKNNFVGWSWGLQENSSTFYMVNSAVLKEHRRNGIYTALVSRCVEVVSKKGFQLIYSRHCTTNNDVIIPKLIAGFIISKMEVDDRFGVLIHLHYYTNSDRRKIMDYRSGHIKPDKKIKDIFNL